jgi:hypothetical protein
LPNTRKSLILLLLLAAWAGSVQAASQLQIVEVTEAGLVIDVHTPVHPPATGPGVAQIRGSGGVALPMVAELFASPPGARADIEVRALSTQMIGDVDLPLADEAAAEHPGVLAQSSRLGVMRGIDAHTLQIFPYAYDPQTRRLTVHEHLRVSVRFAGGSARRPVGDTGPPSPLHRAFINPPDHDGWRQPMAAARPAQDGATDWYDPALPWVKIFVEADGIHRITAAHLRDLPIDPGRIDPTRLRLVRRGIDQPVYVSGGEDGRLDEEDEILFVGRYRRAPSSGPDSDSTGERDHESEYGPRETYWLTWEGEQISHSYRVVSGAPTNDYPALEVYEHRKHEERDRAFAILEEAPGDLSDRWFWQNDRPLKSSSPDTRATQTIIATISGLPEEVDEYDARLRVSVMGETPAVVGDHHAFLTLNQQQLAEAVWSGQTSYLFDETIPSSLLKGRNELLFQAQADLASHDWIWFNWYELTYRRQFHAYPGELLFPTEPAPDGHRITVEGFRHPDIVLFDVTQTHRLTDLQITLEDSLYSATFEAAPAQASRYVIADSLSIHQPALELDTPSDLRGTDVGAQALIVSSANFLDAANRLADHRRTRDGLSVQVVSMQDIFDEYNDGNFAREPLAEFLSDVYQRWTPRPTFVLLFGDTTWDYRGIRASHREYQLVPTLYYHARDRGYSPSDHLLSLVDGDDQLPDLIIGRLPVDSEEEAEFVVDKIIDYDTRPAAGNWRGKAILAANWHPTGTFVAPNDSIASRHLEPVGLRPQRFYAPDEEDLPNVTGKAFLDALNEGALVLNFAGHGGVGSMHFFLSAEFPDWDYMSQISNGPRLPLITALSCLNGRFTEPTAEGLSEQFVEHPHGGAIAYVSATAVSLTAQNELLSDFFYDALIGDDPLPFGAALSWAKARVLSVHTSFVDVPLTMQLTGDPMQRLALQTAPDYVAHGLRIEADPVLSSRAQPVVVILSNDARRGVDSLRVQLVATSLASVDTLFDERRPAFVGRDSLQLSWQPAAGGDYRMRLFVDADDHTSELDEANNLYELNFDVLVPREATPLWPTEEAASADLQLQALTPLDEVGLSETHPDVVEFALSSSPDFEDGVTTLQTAVTSPVGQAQTQATAPPGATPGDLLYWRTRLIDGAQLGPWSVSRALRWTEGDVTDSVTPSIQWVQPTSRLLQLDGSGLKLRDSQVTAAALSPPFRPTSLTRDIKFTVLSLPGAGVLATDGTYLYAKRWFNDASTIYAGNDVFTRIGTGLNGSIQGGFYGSFPEATTDSTTGETIGATTAGIAATWHDGYIYSDAGMSYAIERIDPVSGHLDTVAVPDGLLDWLTGRVVTDEARRPRQVLHAMFTSDGERIYNVSMSSERGTRVGWGVRVFDIDGGGDWQLLREFIIPPTEDGFTFRWTDGIIADGERLYLMEFGGERRIRMVDAETGAFRDEWRSDQDATRSITGQYDPVNGLVWLGDLQGSGLFGYPRDGVTPAGELTSDPIGPAATWGPVQVTGDGARVQVEGRRADGSWDALASGTAPLQIELDDVDASRYRHLRLQSQIGPDTTQTLTDWSVSFEPAADLALRAASADVVEGQLLVQTWVRNLGITGAGAADLRLERGVQVLAQAPVPALARGQSVRVAFDPIPFPESGEGLLLRLTPSTADGAGGNDALELVLTVPGLTTITFASHASGHRLMNGDVLSTDASIRVLAPPLASGRLELRIDGDVVTVDSSWTDADGALALHHRVAVGTHALRAALIRDGIELGVGELEIRVDDRLHLSQVLLAPHPMRSEGAFTWMLSHAAHIRVDIFAVSGRQIRSLRPAEAGPGFGQLPWDGRDAGGRRVAAGTYLYVLTATGLEDPEVVRLHRGAFVVLP